jgi:hypothetical protein
VVYIEPEEAVFPRPLPVEGHWEPAGPSRPPEEGPGWATASEGIAWGRERAPEVLLRLDRNVYRHRYVLSGGLVLRLVAPVERQCMVYSAGEKHVAYEEDEVRIWPEAASTTDRAPGYGGTVFLAQAPSESDRGEPVGYTARWEALLDGSQRVVELAGPAWEGELDRAVAWARERAPYVLVRQAVGLGYESAGEHEPPGLGLGRWIGADALETEADPDPQSTWILVVTEEDDSRYFPIPNDIEPAGGLPPA